MSTKIPTTTPLEVLAALGIDPSGGTYKYVPGTLTVDATVSSADVTAALATAAVASLASTKKTLCADIDALADDARGRHITVGSAQSMVYVQKAAEADAYKAAAYPSSTSSYPMLAAEAAATNQTAQQVADAVIAARDAWVATSGSIEAIRVPAKTAINAAADRAAAQTAHDNAKTALAAI